MLPGKVVILLGKTNIRDGVSGIICDDFRDISEVYETIKSVRINLGGVDPKEMKRFKKRLAQFPGKVPVYLEMDTKKYKSVQILIGKNLFIQPSEHLFNNIKDMVGEENFAVTL